MTPEVLTIGHSSLSIADFIRILGAHSIGCVVDVRSWPASRRHPHFGREPLSSSLGAASIAYEWEADLGGRRRGSSAPSRHTAIAEPALRAYVDHLHSPAAAAAIGRLLERAGACPTAVMCAERDPARCHRLLLADRLVVLGLARVIHIIDETLTEPHVPSPGIVVEGGTLVYAPVQQELLP